MISFSSQRQKHKIFKNVLLPELWRPIISMTVVKLITPVSFIGPICFICIVAIRIKVYGCKTSFLFLNGQTNPILYSPASPYPPYFPPQKLDFLKYILIYLVKVEQLFCYGRTYLEQEIGNRGSRYDYLIGKAYL